MMRHTGCGSLKVERGEIKGNDYVVFKYCTAIKFE
jgi:hypothetical protein